MAAVELELLEVEDLLEEREVVVMVDLTVVGSCGSGLRN